MGVDHDSVSGIGFQIDVDHIIDNIDLSEFEDSIGEYFCELDLEGKYEYGEIGAGAYTGDENEFFIFIKESLLKGFDNVESQKGELLEFITNKGLKIKGDFGLHQGVHTW